MRWEIRKSTVLEIWKRVSRVLLEVAALLMRIEAKVDAHGAKVDAHGAKVDAVATLQTNMVTVSPVTESAAATQTRGRDWHIKVVNYYDCQQCMVLSQLYPDERRLPDWFSKDDHFRKACSPFPAVAEHIIPKGQEIVGKSWDVDIHDGCNGLLLLRHLERMYQAGKWSMLPVTEGTEAGMFQIYVADDCHEERIMYYPEFGEARHCVKVSDRPLTLADLHGKRIELIGKYQANPSLRALFLKAMMAHKVHQSLPDPETRLQSYAMKCQKMSMPNWHIWRTSVPDPGLPVVQTVPHEHED